MTHPDDNDTPRNLEPSAVDRIMADAALLHTGLHPDPFAVLGRHGAAIVRSYGCSCPAPDKPACSISINQCGG